MLNPDDPQDRWESVTNCDSVTNHAGGPYNDALMKHVQPEYDYRIDTSAERVQKTPEFRHVQIAQKSQSQNVMNPCLHHQKPYWQSIYSHNILSPDGGMGGVRCSVIPFMS